MVDFIAKETKKIMYKCCSKYATENKKDISEIQLILSLNTNPEIEEPNRYTICENYVPKKQLDINGVLGVKYDFLGYSRIAPPFIFKSLVRFCELHNIGYDKVNIMCLPTTNEKNKPEILLALYNGMDYVDTITFEELFREDDFEIQK
jgi:hypothetical protein